MRHDQRARKWDVLAVTARRVVNEGEEYDKRVKYKSLKDDTIIVKNKPMIVQLDEAPAVSAHRIVNEVLLFSLRRLYFSFKTCVFT